MSAVPSERFANRPTTVAGTNGISRFSRFGFSTHAQGLRLRRVHLALAISRAKRCCLPLVRTRSAHGKEDFGAQYLACASPGTDAQHDVVTAVAPPPEAEVDGYSFFVRNFHSLSKTGFIPAHPDSFFCPFVCFPKSASRLCRQFGLQLLNQIAGLTKSQLLTLSDAELAR